MAGQERRGAREARRGETSQTAKESRRREKEKEKEEKRGALRLNPYVKFTRGQGGGASARK